MYKNEDEFARGQKIKIAITVAIMIAVVLYSYFTTGSFTEDWWH